MPGQDRRDEALIRRAFIQFSLLSASLVFAVVVGVLVIGSVLTGQASDAHARTRGEVVAAVVEAGLEDADFAAKAEQAASGAGVRAAVIWEPSGRVLWATREALIGQTFAIDPEVAELFGSDEQVAAEEGDRLDAARPSGLLGNEIEVFTPITDPRGRPLVVETYVDAAVLDGLGSSPFLLLVPLGVAAFGLFVGMALLVGSRLARRVQASRRERIKLLTASMGAVENERRRLAHELHDGIIQDLAATRYALTSVMQTIPSDLPGAPRARLARVCELLADELDVLRRMLGEMVPPEDPEVPRPQMFHTLVERLVPEGVAWSVEVDASVGTVDTGTVALALRIVQEGVRNAVRHARPTRIDVRVSTSGDDERLMRVVVEDDGVGPQPRSHDHGGRHYGLQLLHDLLLDLGGEQQLLSTSDGGARLVAEWPLTAADDTAEPAPVNV